MGDAHRRGRGCEFQWQFSYPHQLFERDCRTDRGAENGRVHRIVSTIDRELSEAELYNLDEVAAAFARKHLNDTENSISKNQYRQWLQHRRDRAGVGSNNYFNGSTKFVNFMLSVIAGLLIAGIGGGILVYGDFKSVQAEVKSIHEIIDLIVQGKLRIGP